MKKNITILFLLLITASLAAHPGRTDRYGGHNGPNGYHYHNSTPTPAPTPAPTPTPAPAATDNITTTEEIRELQNLLTTFRFYNGQITGTYNEATIIAANNARIQYNVSNTPYTSMVRRELLLRLRNLPRP